jgi:hypothetical protein
MGNDTDKDESNVGGLLMELAEGGSDIGTSTPAENDAITVPPAPTEKDARTTPPASTGNQAITTPDKPTDSQQKGTPTPDRPATRGSESSRSDNDTKDEEYMSCFLEWLGLDPDCKRMMHHKTTMLAHHKRKMANQGITLFEHVVNNDLELCTEARPHITAAV